MSYSIKLSGEDLPRYIIKIESVDLRKAYSVSAAKNVYISLPYNMAARTASIDKNVELRQYH